MAKHPYKGAVTFHSSDEQLDKGFQWAKEQALFFSHEGDRVGDWYEAALPDREAFCMRDVSHHIDGAQILGLAGHSKNMLLRFAQGIAESRDYCSFWEISKDYLPTPVDYRSDEDFWYNLPANFDVLDACYRAYQWTGDEQYLKSRDFWNFYDLSTHEYVKKWDIDGDGLLERESNGSRRGIPSYNEQEGIRCARSMVDLPCVQVAGYRAYAQLCRLTGKPELAEEFSEKASRVQDILDTRWWDEQAGCYYQIQYQDLSMGHTNAPGSTSSTMLYYHAIRDAARVKSYLERLMKPSEMIVEGASHLAEVFYHYGLIEQADQCLRYLTDPELKRREYPEVSYSVVGDYARGMMGLEAMASQRRITTLDNAVESVTFTEMQRVPVLGGHIDLRHEKDGKRRSTTLTNHTGDKIVWEACFHGAPESIDVQRSSPYRPAQRIDGMGSPVSFVRVEVLDGETRTISRQR